MAPDDLDIPRIAVVGVPDNNNPSSSSLALPSSSVDSSRLPASPSYNHTHLRHHFYRHHSQVATKYLGSLGFFHKYVQQFLLLLPFPPPSLPTPPVRFVGQIQRFYVTIAPRNTMGHLHCISLHPLMVLDGRVA